MNRPRKNSNTKPENLNLYNLPIKVLFNRFILSLKTYIVKNPWKALFDSVRIALSIIGLFTIVKLLGFEKENIDITCDKTKMSFEVSKYSNYNNHASDSSFHIIKTYCECTITNLSNRPVVINKSFRSINWHSNDYSTDFRECSIYSKEFKPIATINLNSQEQMIVIIPFEVGISKNSFEFLNNVQELKGKLKIELCPNITSNLYTRYNNNINISIINSYLIETYGKDIWGNSFKHDKIIALSDCNKIYLNKNLNDKPNGYYGIRLLTIKGKKIDHYFSFYDNKN